MARKVGDRVGAILGTDPNGVVRFIGYGEYVGDEIPPEHVGGLNFGVPNPKIVLDSGKYVFGCECWWGSEERIREVLEATKQVVNIDIDDYRSRNDSTPNQPNPRRDDMNDTVNTLEGE